MTKPRLPGDPTGRAETDPAASKTAPRPPAPHTGEKQPEGTLPPKNTSEEHKNIPPKVQGVSRNIRTRGRAKRTARAAIMRTITAPPAKPTVGKKKKPRQIGSLSAGHEPKPIKPTWVLDLHTRQAVKIFLGRSQKRGRRGIPGLAKFITYTNLIWDRAKKDDPWADWYLLKIEQRIEQSEAKLYELQNRLNNLLCNSSHGIRLVEMGESAGPVPFPLAFIVPQGFMVAELVGLYDEVVMAIVIARQRGKVDLRLSERWIHEGARAVRAAFNSPYGYRNCMVNRILVLKQTPHAKKAHKFMGPLPKEVLQRTLAPAHQPGPSFSYKLRLTKKAQKIADQKDSGESSLSKR